MVNLRKDSCTVEYTSAYLSVKTFPGKQDLCLVSLYNAVHMQSALTADSIAPSALLLEEFRISFKNEDTEYFFLLSRLDNNLEVYVVLSDACYSESTVFMF